MKVEALLRQYRRPQYADDETNQPLAEDDDVFEWMTEAESEAALRGKLLYDETTAAICRIPVTAGRTSYRLDSRIFEVAAVWLDRPASGTPTSSTEVRLVDQSNAWRRSRRAVGPSYGFLAPTGSDYGNDFCGGNRAIREGSYIREASVDGQNLTLYTIPDASFTTSPAVLRICAYRTPLKPITGVDDCFEIPAVHHRGLIHWLGYRGCGGTDSESGVNARADKELAMFESIYGERPSADVMRARSEHRSMVVRPRR